MIPTSRRALLRAGLLLVCATVMAVLSSAAASGPFRAASPVTAAGLSGVEPLQIVRAAGSIRGAVARYRALLGPDNGGVSQGFPSGRREINWDGVPDELARPNLLPAGFFNARVEPRALGSGAADPRLRRGGQRRQR
jgi:hypothetical protein